MRRRLRTILAAAAALTGIGAGIAGAAAWSSSVTATTTVSTATVAAATNMASTHPNATGANAGQVNLTWTAPASGVSSLRVQRGTSATGPWTTLQTLAANATAYNHTGATYNADNYYRVQSVAGTWTAETPVWSSHSLRMASGSQSVGSATPTALTAAQVNATATAEGTYATNTYFQPTTWPTSPQYVAGAFYLDTTHAWITGTGSVSFYDGTNWTRYSTPTGTADTTFEQVAFTSTTKGWAVGQNGAIITTSNGGTGWTTQTSPTTANLWDLTCPGTNTCIAVGNSGTAINTTNGTSWQQRTTPSTTPQLFDVECVSVSTCWAAGSGGTILKTTNSGNTWTGQTSGTSARLQAITCRDANTCWAVGENGVMRVTTNGGTNWTAGSSGTTDSLWRMRMFASGVGYLAGSGGIAKTTDGGASWAPLTVPEGIYYALSCIDQVNCLTGSTTPAALITKNGGETWSEALPGHIEFVPVTPNLAPTTGVSSVVARFSYRATTNPAGARFLLFASKDEGETWTSFPLATPTGANVTTTQSIDITSLGFATPSDATKLRLRFTIVPAPSGTLTTRIDLVHIDVN